MEPKKPTWGGTRKGAGRPKEETKIVYYRRVTPAQAQELDVLLEQLKKTNMKFIDRFAPVIIVALLIGSFIISVLQYIEY